MRHCTLFCQLTLRHSHTAPGIYHIYPEFGSHWASANRRLSSCGTGARSGALSAGRGPERLRFSGRPGQSTCEDREDEVGDLGGDHVLIMLLLKDDKGHVCV